MLTTQELNQKHYQLINNLKMKKSSKIQALLAGAAMLAVSCGPDKPVITPEISASPTTLAFVAANPAAQTVSVTSNVEWKAAAADSWLTINPKSGSGNGSISVSAAANVAPEGEAAPARSSNIELTIEGRKIAVQVKQDAETVVFAVEGTPTEVPCEGASVSVKVEANTTYTFSSSADWCTLADGGSTKAVKTDNLKFVAAANTSAGSRSATITFTPADGSSKTITVNQAARPDGIYTAEEFAAFAAALEKGDLTEIDRNGDKVINLLVDIDAGTLAAPLDTLPAAYTFDGKDHKIQYSISSTSAEILNLGLFCVVQGKVKNLKVAGSVKYSPEPASLTAHMGGVTGLLGPAGVIENCSSSVNLLGDTKITHHIGGIAGYTASGATVKGCVNEGEVKMAIPELGTANASQVGGIIGHIEGTAVLENCENKGSAVYEGLGTPRLAGIVGYVNNLTTLTIKNAKNSGEIIFKAGAYTGSSWSYVGGITGYNGTPTDGAVLNYENCVNTGTITNTITDIMSRVRVGGIMCHGGGTKGGFMTYNLKDCSNSGKIIVTSATTDRTIAGGLIGFAESNATVNVEGGSFSGAIESLGGGKVGGIIGSTGNVASTIKNITVTKDAVLKSENGFKPAGVGIIGGTNSKFTTAVTGKVAGTIIDGGTTWIVNKNNFQNHLFGVELGEGGSTDGVTCDEEGDPDPGADVSLPFIEDFAKNTWTTDGSDSSVKLTTADLPQFSELTDVFWARPSLGGVKIGTGSRNGTLVTKELDLSQDFYVKVSAAAYNATEGALRIAVGDDVRTIDLVPEGNKVVAEYGENFSGTQIKNVRIYTETLRAYIVSIEIQNGKYTAPSVKYISSVTDMAALLSDAAALADANAVYKLTQDIDLGGAVVPAAAGPFAATFDGRGHVIKNAKLNGPVIARNDGVIKNLIIDSSVEFTPAVSGDMGVLVGLSYGTISGCTNKASIKLTSEPGALFLAGIVARSSGVVEDCKNEGSIIIDAAKATSNVYLGGVVARAGDKSGTDIVKNCSNSGKISVTYSGTPKVAYIGGVMGSTNSHKENEMVLQGTVSGCVNSGEVTYTIGTPATGTYTNLGGVAGYIEGEVKSCSNSAKVGFLNPEVEDASVVCTRPAVGGVLGCVLGSIEDCSNTGEVTMTGSFSAGTAGNAGAGGSSNPTTGGVVGCVGKSSADNTGYLKNSTNSAAVIVVTRQKVAGKTQSRIGGVAGFSSVPVSGCHNEGALDIKSLSYKNMIGGVVGCPYNDIVDCWNDAPVNVDGRPAVVSAFKQADNLGYQFYAGGIYGYVYLKEVKFQNVVNRSKGVITLKDAGCKAAYSYVGGIGGGYETSPNIIQNASNEAALNVDSETAVITGGICGGFNGDVSDVRNTGVVTVKRVAGDAGKEPETGGVIGYLNGSLTSAVSEGALSFENAAVSYMGGFVGGFGNADKLFSSIELKCSLTPAAASTTASVIGRFRNPPANPAAPNTVTLGADGAPVTINAANSSLPVCGFTNGHKVVEANVVRK